MKVIVFKAVALVVILAFALMLLPQQSDAQANLCQRAQLACIIARLIAAEVCADMAPAFCDLANHIASVFCDFAEVVCGLNNNP